MTSPAAKLTVFLQHTAAKHSTARCGVDRMPFCLPNRSNACCTDFTISQYDGSFHRLHQQLSTLLLRGQLQLLVTVTFTHGQSLQPSPQIPLFHVNQAKASLAATSHDPGERSTIHLQSPLACSQSSLLSSSHFTHQLRSSQFFIATIFLSHNLPPTQDSNFCPSLSPQQHENTRAVELSHSNFGAASSFPLTWTPVFLLVLGQHFCRA